ncbi:MAG: J domain-containing protein [Pseudomonadota bacterium]
MPQDLYATLGVSKRATADEIRSAYRRKAKALHPDLHPGDKVKSDEFKAVSAAFEILGDETKRRRYDNGEIDATGEARGPAGFAGGFQGDPFEDIFSGMFGAGRRRPGPRKGADMRYRVEIAFEDAVLGAKRDMTMADGRVLSVSIPAGLESGQTLRLKSQGQPSRSGGPPGDALLEVSVRTSETWERQGSNLRMSVPVPVKTAILGGSVDVQTPAGPVSLRIPEGANTGAVLRLRDKGVQTAGKPGHLFARIELFLEDPKDPKLRAWAKKA